MGHFYQRLGICSVRKFNVDVFNIDNGVMIPRLEGTLSGQQLSKIIRTSLIFSRGEFRVFYVKTSSTPFSSRIVEAAVVLRTVRDISVFDYRVTSIRRDDKYLALIVVDR